MSKDIPTLTKPNLATVKRGSRGILLEGNSVNVKIETMCHFHF